MFLSVDCISKKYGKQEVLKDLSFSIKKGEIVGFLGPNGAGKTTSMKIITGSISPDKGKVLINDIDLLENPVKARRLIGYLPENNPLYDEMYISEYLEYALKLYPFDGSVREKIKETIIRTGLQPEAHKIISKLSKGYRQRVGIAQAIIHNPDLLILDEPTSGLDPNQLDEIISLIKSLSEKKAILLSSHTLPEVASICTRIIIINKGIIVADKPINEIDNLEKLFKDLTKE